MIKNFFIYTTAFLILTLTSSFTITSLCTPKNNYVIKILRRKVSTGKPLIFGRIESISYNGAYLPVMLAYVSIANQGTKSDENGNYSFDISPGRYNISIRCIGYQPIMVRGVEVSKSDSIRIDFHLVADTVKL
jgi:uncharacterized membrane protein